MLLDAGLPQWRGLGILLSQSALCIACLEDGNGKTTSPQVTECEVRVKVERLLKCMESERIFGGGTWEDKSISDG